MARNTSFYVAPKGLRILSFEVLHDKDADHLMVCLSDNSIRTLEINEETKEVVEIAKIEMLG